MDFRDAHVLITGGSKGIGAALARELARRQARLTLVARPTAQLEAAAAEVGGTALPADLSDAANHAGLIERAEAANGPVDVLVNNAGIGMTQHYGTLAAEDVTRTLTTNLLAPMELSRQVLPGMLERDRGTIANVSSVVGELAVPHLACYGTSKAGLTMFSLDVQRDIRHSNVNVAVFALGAVPGTEIYNEGTLNPTIKKLAGQIERFAKTTPEQVATGMADAIAADHRGAMALPKSSAPMLAWRLLPVRLGDLVFSRGKAESHV